MQGRLLRLSQLKAVLQFPESINRDELVLPRVWRVSRADSFDGLSQGVPLRPHEDCRQLGPEARPAPPEQLRERVARPVFWSDPGRDCVIRAPRFYWKAGPAQRSARRADVRLRALRECYTI